MHRTMSPIRPLLLPELFLQRLTIATTDGHGSAIEEMRSRVAGIERFDLFYPIEIQDRAAMHARETLPDELLLDVGHGFTQGVQALADMQCHVVACRLDPIDVFNLHKEFPA